MSDNVSQELYIGTKASANSCKINQRKQFIGNQNTLLESEYNNYLTQRCADPLPQQKHVPQAMGIACATSGGCV